MWDIIKSDFVASYAAALSTIIAFAAFIRWLMDGPKAWSQIINPLDFKLYDQRMIKLIVSNTGKQPILVREMVISSHSRRFLSPVISHIRLYHGAKFDPAIELVPNPNGKPNSSVPQPRVIDPGNEFHQIMQPFENYDASKHWLKLQVYLRHKRSPVVAWAAPIPVSPQEP